VRTLLVLFAITIVFTDSVEQTAPGTRPPLGVLESFDGLGAGMTAGPGTNNPPAPRNPSDNTLAVGRDHIVQVVNSQLAVFSKKGSRYSTTGQTLLGPVSTNTIFAGFGGTLSTKSPGLNSVMTPPVAKSANIAGLGA